MNRITIHFSDHLVNACFNHQSQTEIKMIERSKYETSEHLLESVIIKESINSVANSSSLLIGIFLNLCCQTKLKMEQTLSLNIWVSRLMIIWESEWISPFNSMNGSWPFDPRVERVFRLWTSERRGITIRVFHLVDKVFRRALMSSRVYLILDLVKSQEGFNFDAEGREGWNSWSTGELNNVFVKQSC